MGELQPVSDAREYGRLYRMFLQGEIAEPPSLEELTGIEREEAEGIRNFGNFHFQFPKGISDPAVEAAYRQLWDEQHL